MTTGDENPSITAVIQLMRTAERLRRELGRDPTGEELAERLGLPPEGVSELIDDLTRTPVVFRPNQRPRPR